MSVSIAYFVFLRWSEKNMAVRFKGRASKSYRAGWPDGCSLGLIKYSINNSHFKATSYALASLKDLPTTVDNVDQSGHT